MRTAFVPRPFEYGPGQTSGLKPEDALPLLKKGEYLHEVDLPHARRLLKAAALTYVAASLMSLLNIARWWALIRR